MPSLFKRTLPNGQPSSTWIGKVRADGKWRNVTLFTDKAASLAELTRLQSIADRRAAGLLTPQTDAADTLLAQHLDDYLADCTRHGFATKHLYMIRMMLKRVFRDAAWVRLRDITTDSARKLFNRLIDGGMSPGTHNRHLACLKAFCNWCLKHERLVANPVAPIAPLRELPNRRSALTDDQMAALLAHTPSPRRDVYLTALLTGLRRGELRQLQWGDLRLDALPAFIQLRATTTKNGRDDVLPMHPELVTLFRGMMAGHPKAKVFAAIPTMKCFRNDLRKAGIPHDTGLCFHSLRHTFCTRLVRSGTTLKAAQQLMRHSTVELTAKVYTHLGITDTASALHGLTLPTLPTAQVMTGTDNLSPPSLPTDAPNHAPLMHQTPRVSVRFGAQSHNSNLLDDPTGESEKPPMLMPSQFRLR